MSSPSGHGSPDSSRALGPLELHDRSLTHQLGGFILVLTGVAIIGWAASLLTPLVPTVLYTALGAFALYNGCYVAGFRFR